MPPRSPLSISGIYKITCRGNGKFYIGSSKHITTRWAAHKRSLRGSYHDSPYMQNSWNKYGEDSFYIEVVEELPEGCGKETLLEREQYYIDTLRPEFNVNKLATSGSEGPVAEETKAKLKKTLRKARAIHLWKGRAMSLVEIAELEGMCFKKLRNRVSAGCSLYDAVYKEGRPFIYTVVWKGTEYTCRELGELLDISSNVLYRKTKEGIPVEDVVYYLQERKREMSIEELCRINGVPSATIKSRMKKGWTALQAITMGGDYGPSY